MGDSIESVQSVRLNTGTQCPVIGIGCGGYFTPGGIPDHDEVKRFIREAILAGYRHVDTAKFYGNARAIGQVVNELIDEGRVKRGELFITNKIYNIEVGGIMDSQLVFEQVQLEVETMGVGYLDLCLIHKPSDDPDKNRLTWLGLESALAAGLVKAIGLSFFDVSQVEELLKTAKTVPAMVQVRSYPGDAQREMIEFCRRRRIWVTAASPLGSGRLLADDTLTAIGHKYGKSAAQVMIRWHIQRGVVCIPKSTNSRRMAANIDVFDFELSVDDMKRIDVIENDFDFSYDKKIFK